MYRHSPSTYFRDSKFYCNRQSLIMWLPLFHVLASVRMNTGRALRCNTNPMRNARGLCRISSCESTAGLACDAEGIRPPGARIEPRSVYYVSTPIGNLEDITLRAVRTLREVDVVASEDTRVTSSLLRSLGISGKQKLISHHDHNLAASVPKLLNLLEDGASVAVVSDAGTPGISDPGLALAAECASRAIPVIPVPGPCAAVAALSVSGFAATEFIFGGFVPRSGRSRRQKLTEFAAEERAVVLYEAPHRMLETLGDLIEAGAGQRAILCAREITKLHEEYHRGTVASALSWYASVAERDGKLRGEFTLVLAPPDAETREERREEAAARAEAAAAEEVRNRVAAGGTLSRVVKEVARELGVQRSKLYAEALRQKAERATGGDS